MVRVIAVRFPPPLQWGRGASPNELVSQFIEQEQYKIQKLPDGLYTCLRVDKHFTDGLFTGKLQKGAKCAAGLDNLRRNTSRDYEIP